MKTFIYEPDSSLLVCDGCGRSWRGEHHLVMALAAGHANAECGSSWTERFWSWGLTAVMVVLAGTLAMCSMGCATANMKAAADSVELAGVAVDVAVEHATTAWAEQASLIIEECQLAALDVGKACKASGRTDEVCGTVVQSEFDQCIAPTMAKAAKVGSALERLIVAQKALLGLGQTMRELDEVLR